MLHKCESLLSPAISAEDERKLLVGPPGNGRMGTPPSFRLPSHLTWVPVLQPSPAPRPGARQTDPPGVCPGTYRQEEGWWTGVSSPPAAKRASGETDVRREQPTTCSSLARFGYDGFSAGSREIWLLGAGFTRFDLQVGFIGRGCGIWAQDGGGGGAAPSVTPVPCWGDSSMSA
ncbi:uncharacterized protein LOC143651724 [Tamandua tetradactyla]|uniref:uncharacterized protein LOC143651724 n=1 Tax=Tamandua tetradactyla TaxID=48850 RepID=UPI00405449B3